MPVATESRAGQSFDYKNTRPFTPQDWISPQTVQRVDSRTFPVRSIEDSMAQTLKKERQARPDSDGTAAWIDYFDSNWQRENLPQDWYNLKSQTSQKRVGFIMDQQMDVLKNPYDKVGLADWVQKTKRDLQGFKLEFLTDNVIYPRRYFRNKHIPTRLEDPLYGKSKDGINDADIAEIVSDKERNGSVKTGIERVKKFFETAPDGSIAVMTSPLGPTGFKTKDGLGIDYPDSYFFMQVKNGDEVMNYTLKTNFKLPAAREAIFQLTGKRLPEDAKLEEYVSSLALIKPSEHEKVQSVTDVVNLLAGIQPEHAFVDTQNGKTTSWESVHAQIAKGEALYNFDIKTNKIIEENEDFGNQGNNSKDMLERGIAVAILRMGEVFFDETQSIDGVMKPDTWYATRNSGDPINNSRDSILLQQKSFGQILEQTAERRGCAGGGKAITVTTMGGQRLAIRAGGSGGGGARGQEQEEGFSCPKCLYEASKGTAVGNQCPGCGITKEAYAKEVGIVCD